MDVALSTGSRIREVRVLRGKSLRVIAALAGISAGYLSKVERDLKVLDSRRTLYALADALQVAPSELTGQPFAPTNAEESTAHAAAQALRAVLRDVEIGELPEMSIQSLPELETGVRKADQSAADSDYAKLGESIPDLIGDLYIPQDGEQQARARLLVRALHDAFYLSKDLGHGDLAWWVSGHLERAAAALSDPAWGAVAGFVRSHAVIGKQSRPRALRLAERATEIVSPDGGDAGQAYGMCHLSAALHNAAEGNSTAARDHLAEAEDVASYTGEGRFAGLMFGPNNVGVWQLAVHLELGNAERGLTIARKVNVEDIPSAGRQATFYSDLGLALARLRGREDQAVMALRRAEDLAPGRVRTRPTVRDTVTNLLPRVKDSAGIELRGMAHRMGIAA